MLFRVRETNKRESEFGLRYKKGRDLSLVGYCNSDYGGDSDGAFFFLGDSVVTWIS